MSAPNLLIHVCCAPCLVAPYYDLKAQGMDVTGFWFNPNIHPLTEYRLRVQSLRDFAGREEIPVIYRDEYNLDDFLRMAAFHETERCEGCYRLRLKATAQQAKAGGFELWTSTLFYSRYQNHELMKQIAEEYASEYGVPFHYQDFREFWQRGIELSKEQEMYRQKYCGCIYSERDRYERKKK